MKYCAGPTGVALDLKPTAGGAAAFERVATAGGAAAFERAPGGLGRGWGGAAALLRAAMAR